MKYTVREKEKERKREKQGTDKVAYEKKQEIDVDL